jgi:hypothetical protein
MRVMRQVSYVVLPMCICMEHVTVCNWLMGTITIRSVVTLLVFHVSRSLLWSNNFILRVYCTSHSGSFCAQFLGRCFTLSPCCLMLIHQDV